MFLKFSQKNFPAPFFREREEGSGDALPFLQGFFAEAGEQQIIAGQENQIRAQPGQHLGPEYARIADQAGQQERRTGAHDKLGQARYHGHHRIAHALQRRAVYI